jgi:hypothetical protein
MTAEAITVTVEGLGDIEVVHADIQWPASVDSVALEIPDNIPLPTPFKIDSRQLAPDEPGFYAFIDMTEKQGREFFEQALPLLGWEVGDYTRNGELSFNGYGWLGTVDVAVPAASVLAERGEGFQMGVWYFFSRPDN